MSPFAPAAKEILCVVKKTLKAAKMFEDSRRNFVLRSLLWIFVSTLVRQGNGHYSSAILFTVVITTKERITIAHCFIKQIQTRTHVAV